MGVPKFYRWVSERYPCLSEVISEHQIPEFDNLYLDMNGIIHNCSHPNDDDIHFRISEDEILRNICAYIENLYNMIRPEKVFFMAVDGVAPRAKMNQQRARRFMSARTAEQQMIKAVREGVELPTEQRFDSNCITPGTTFMWRLHNMLANWVEKKIAEDSKWQNRRIYLSGHDCPGEGEHKIMDFIRTERAQPNYNPNTRHCMYGLDADLIMLGIVSHEPHFSLLREEVTFSIPRKSDKKKNKAPKRTDIDTKRFHLLHLSLLREYLSWEFASIKEKTPFDYDVERIVDDWILMGLLIGNDFLPHLPNVHIHDNALPLLYETYKKVLPTLDGYINEAGYLNLPRFQKFLLELANNDKSAFMQNMEDEGWMASKRSGAPPAGQEEQLRTYFGPEDEEEEMGEELEAGKNALGTMKMEDDGEEGAFDSSDEEEEGEEDLHQQESFQDSTNQRTSSEDDDLLQNEFNDELALSNFMAMDEKEFENSVDACWTRTVNNSFKKFKKNYYSEKMKYANISKAGLKGQAEGYVRAIQWNLHYYYHGCVSWSWFYPHHYAPYISDVTNFTEMVIEFDLSKPFQPFEQLLAVLPEASKECLPKPLQELMSGQASNSPISDFYPMDFGTDLNGKKNDWEAVVLIPFIEEPRLLEAMQVKMPMLSQEELRRNQHGPHLLFTTEVRNSKIHVTRTLIDKDAFRIPQSQVVWGLLPNAKTDVFFPGFPTMKHLKHKGELKVAHVNVFGMTSKKDSMVLTVSSPDEKDIIEWGAELLEEQVCIDWPILRLAKVDAIWGDGRIVRKSKNDEIVVKDMDEQQKALYVTYANTLEERQMTRYAIELEQKKDSRPFVALVRRFVGLVYEQVSENGGPPILRPIKKWTTNDEEVSPVLLPLVVKDCLLEESRRLSNLSIKLAFPVNTVAWTTNPKSALFGFPGMIEGYTNEVNEKCVVKLFGMTNDPRIDIMEELRAQRERKNLRWMGGYDAARQANVNVGLFQRITGHVMLWNEKRVEVERGGQISYENKLNMGLALKYSKRNLCLTDYTDRREFNGKNGPIKSWVYSSLTTRLVTSYKSKFPEVLSYLDTHSDAEDVYYAEDIWSNEEKRNKRFAELKEFMEELPSKEAEQIECGTDYADRQLIVEIEKLTSGPVKATMKKVELKPIDVFRPELYDGRGWPDRDADFLVLDRVSCTGFGGVPKTNQGTIIGIHGDKVDVLFDREFPGGSKVRGSTKASVLRIPKLALINITYGMIRKYPNDKKGRFEKLKQVDELDNTYVPWQPKQKNDRRGGGAKKEDLSKVFEASHQPKQQKKPHIEVKLKNQPSTSSTASKPPPPPPRMPTEADILAGELQKKLTILAQGNQQQKPQHTDNTGKNWMELLGAPPPAKVDQKKSNDDMANIMKKLAIVKQEKPPSPPVAPKVVHQQPPKPVHQQPSVAPKAQHQQSSVAPNVAHQGPSKAMHQEPPMRQQSYQQQQLHHRPQPHYSQRPFWNGYRNQPRPPKLNTTDFKPSSLTRTTKPARGGARNNNKVIVKKPEVVVVKQEQPVVVEQQQQPPTTSDNVVVPPVKKERKKKKSRLAINFDTK